MQINSLSLESPLGTLYTLATEDALLYLGFQDLATVLQHKPLLRTLHATHTILCQKNSLLTLVESQLELYFSRSLQTFTIPLQLLGSPFQQTVWHGLNSISYGDTRSYKQHAHAIGHTNAYRATGTANGANMIAIVLPCHRVIAHNGTLGGYNGGLERKKWLLDHEKKLGRSYEHTIGNI